jgi:hypothetical protein
MSRERQNLYREIHKGIRAVAHGLVEQAGRTDFGSVEEVRALRGAAEKAFGVFASHAEHETKFVTPLLRTAAPALAADSEAEHQEQEIRLRDLGRTLDLAAGAGEAAPALGHAFVVALSRFVGEMLVHMADEEEQLMPALRAAFDDGALEYVHQALLAAVPPAEKISLLAWMLPALNGPERATLLAGLRAGLPTEAFEAVSGVARQVLAPPEWSRLERSLAVAA